MHFGCEEACLLSAATRSVHKVPASVTRSTRRASRVPNPLAGRFARVFCRTRRSGQRLAPTCRIGGSFNRSSAALRQNDAVLRPLALRVNAGEAHTATPSLASVALLPCQQNAASICRVQPSRDTIARTRMSQSARSEGYQETCPCHSRRSGAISPWHLRCFVGGG